MEAVFSGDPLDEIEEGLDFLRLDDGLGDLEADGGGKEALERGDIGIRRDGQDQLGIEGDQALAGSGDEGCQEKDGPGDRSAEDGEEEERAFALLEIVPNEDQREDGEADQYGPGVFEKEVLDGGIVGPVVGQVSSPLM